MKRDEILLKGTYSSLPKIILASQLLLPSDKLIYISLVDRLGEHTTSWPGFGRLAIDTGLTRPTVITSIRRLEFLTLIEVDSSLSEKDSNNYTLTDVSTWDDRLKSLTTQLKSLTSKTALLSSKTALLPQLKSLTSTQLKSLTTLVKELNYPSKTLLPELLKKLPKEQPKCEQQKEQPKEQLNLSPSETERETSQASLAIRDESSTLRIPDDMHRTRFIQLIKQWKEQAPLTLTERQITTYYKVMVIEEKKAGMTLNPDLVVPSAIARGISFRQLFNPDNHAYMWCRLQDKSSKESISPLETSSDIANDKAPGEISTVIKKSKKPSWTREQLLSVYQAYPKKVGRAAALEKIRKALNDIAEGGHEDPLVFLLERVQIYAKSHAGNKGEFTPHPSTWFHQARYLDDEKEWQAQTQDRTSRIVDDKDYTDYEPMVNNNSILDIF